VACGYNRAAISNSVVLLLRTRLFQAVMGPQYQLTAVGRLCQTPAIANFSLQLSGNTGLQPWMAKPARNDRHNSRGECWQRRDAVWRTRCLLALTRTRYSAAPDTYDFSQAAKRVREADYPQADDFAVQSVLTPPSEEKMLEVFTLYELRP